MPAIVVDPYAHIAAPYDAELEDATADVTTFLRRGAGGPALVLGCGTGRVTRRLAAQRPVTGLDLSEPMLARARQLHPDGTYVHGDMRRFDLGRFAEIFVPNGAFSFLPTRADQAACLRSCARALPDGAPLWIDVPMPDFSLLGSPHTPERPAWEGVVDGERTRRTREVFRWPAEQRLELIDRYYTDEGLVQTSTLKLRLVFPAELEWMLEACGFWVDERYGDHQGRPVAAGCPRLLVRAIRIE